MESKPVSKRKVILNSFLGGIAWGVGSILGATVIIALLLWFLSTLNQIPFLGDIAKTISQTISPPKVDRSVK